MINSILLIALALFVDPTYAAVKNVGTAVISKGQVILKASKDAKAVRLKKGQKIPEGSFVRVGKKGLVKIQFVDKNEVTLGPESEFQVDRYSKATKVATLLKGKTRIKFPKDKLKDKIKKKKKNKFFLRTKSATMGVRGTEFQVVYNKKNQITTALGITGEVAMIKNESAYSTGSDNLNSALDTSDTVRITRGTFSGVNPSQAKATLPVKISPAQFYAIRKNNLFRNQTRPTTSANKISPIPSGVNPKSFANTQNTLETQISQNTQVAVTAPTETAEVPDAPEAPPAEGFADASSGETAPPAGGFIDQNTGLYVPPPPDSTYDPNTGVYIPPPTFGGFSADTGQYVPPEGVRLDATQGFVATNPKNKDAVPNYPNQPQYDGPIPGSQDLFDVYYQNDPDLPNDVRDRRRRIEEGIELPRQKDLGPREAPKPHDHPHIPNPDPGQCQQCTDNNTGNSSVKFHLTVDQI